MNYILIMRRRRKYKKAIKATIFFKVSFVQKKKIKHLMRQTDFEQDTEHTDTTDKLVSTERCRCFQDKMQSSCQTGNVLPLLPASLASLARAIYMQCIITYLIRARQSSHSNICKAGLVQTQKYTFVFSFILKGMRLLFLFLHVSLLHLKIIFKVKKLFSQPFMRPPNNTVLHVK